MRYSVLLHYFTITRIQALCKACLSLEELLSLPPCPKIRKNACIVYFSFSVLPVPRKEVAPSCLFFPGFPELIVGAGPIKTILCRTQHCVISSKLASSSASKLSTNLPSLAVIPALEWLRMYFIGISCAWHKGWFQFASAGMSLKYNIWIDGVSRVQGGSAWAGFTGVMEQQGWVGLVNVFRPHKTLSGALRCLTWGKFALAAGGTEFIFLGSRIELFFF